MEFPDHSSLLPLRRVGYVGLLPDIDDKTCFSSNNVGILQTHGLYMTMHRLLTASQLLVSSPRTVMKLWKIIKILRV